MIEPKEIVVKGKKFIISKFTATAGREIIARYSSSSQPKMGDYKSNEEIMYKIMSHVAVIIEGSNQPLVLSTQALVDNHIKDWEMLFEIELKTMEYNCSFFTEGQISTLFQDLALKAQQSILRT